MTPVSSQTAISQPGAPTSRAISAETTKMPEPIIDPATSIVASNRPRRFWKPASGAAAAGPSSGVMVLLMATSPLGLQRDRFAQVPADRAVAVAVEQVDEQPQHQPADQPPPGGQRQEQHHQQVDGDAQRGQDVD